MVKDPHQDFIKRFERELKQLTKRSWSVTMDERIKRLNQAIHGWINYFRMGSMHERKPQADRWISAEQNADCHMETVEDREN